MKNVIPFILLFLACQAKTNFFSEFPFEIFIDQLNVSQSNKNESLKCIDTIKNVSNYFMDSLHYGNNQQNPLAETLLALIDQVESNIVASCWKIFSNLFEYWEGHSISVILRNNLEQNYPELFHQLGMILMKPENFGNPESASEMKASYIGSMFNLLFTENIDFEDPSLKTIFELKEVPFNATRFISDFILGFFMGFNAFSFDVIQNTTQCALDIYDLTNHLLAQGFERKEGNVTQYFLKAELNCEKAWKIVVEEWNDYASTKVMKTLSRNGLIDLLRNFKAYKGILDKIPMYFRAGRYQKLGLETCLLMQVVIGSIQEVIKALNFIL